MLRKGDPLRRTLRRWRNVLYTRGAVLLYHRVGDFGADHWSMGVGRRQFSEHLDVLARKARCLPLPEFLEKCRGGRVPRDAVALTFDDGYADNLYEALPLLEQFDVPATLFATSGFIGARQEAWWDRIEQVLLGPVAMPPSFELSIGSSRIRWPDRVNGTSDAARLALHDAVYRAMSRLDTPVREDTLASLWETLGVSPAFRATHRMLNAGELHALAAHPLITIGAHTRSHPHLPHLGNARRYEELSGGKSELEAFLDRPVDLVAYPHGAHDARTVKMAREIGFSAACTTIPQAVPRRPDMMRVPRIAIGNEDGAGFARRLAGVGIRLSQTAEPRRRAGADSGAAA